MIILGIDPALTKLGWAVIKKNSNSFEYIASGTIKTDSKSLMHKRLAYISQRIEEVIGLYNPNIVGMEETFVNKSPRSSLILGYARGAIMSIIGRCNLPFYECTPNQVKKTIVGAGHAEKEQVLHMVRLLIKGSQNVKALDESDALAIAYTSGVLSVECSPVKVL